VFVKRSGYWRLAAPGGGQPSKLVKASRLAQDHCAELFLPADKTVMVYDAIKAAS
jgi:hypothetical protein